MPRRSGCRVGQVASPRSWWRISSACSALMGGNREAVVFAACRIVSRSVSVRASSSIARRGLVVVVGVWVWGVGILFIPDRYAYTPEVQKQQSLHLAIRAGASYYMWMVSAVVPLEAPKTGSGTGVPIRRPRSSHQRNVTVVKIVHHRQPAVVISGSTVVAICHHRRPALVLDGGATVAPRSARAHGGENFPPPCPSQRSRKFCRTVPAPGAGERLRKFSGPVAPARFAPADGMVVPIRHHHGLPARGVRRRHSGGTVGVPLARWEEISSHRARGFALRGWPAS